MISIILFAVDVLEPYRALARYNRWMNEKLFDASATLPDAERKRDLKAPFDSIHGTWNHLLLTDRAWLGRFTGAPFGYQSLADELYTDFDELRRQRALTDDAIAAFVNDLTAEKLASTLRFVRPNDPTEHALPLWVCVTHLFNHQTHHRGQITTLLEQLGVDFGVTDFPKMPGVELEQT